MKRPALRRSGLLNSSGGFLPLDNMIFIIRLSRPRPYDTPAADQSPGVSVTLTNRSGHRGDACARTSNALLVIMAIPNSHIQSGNINTSQIIVGICG